MSFIEKHSYKVYNIRYVREEYLNSVYMSQFPTNEEIFSAIQEHVGMASDIKDYRFERLDDKWFKPVINVYCREDHEHLFLRIYP